MHKGKTNQVGRIEYGAALRHKEALLCPIGAVAFYLFWRWQIENEPFPGITERRRWYNIRLLKGKDREKDISYTAQLEGVKKAFKACGIDSSVWTHANRGSGAKLAVAQGADEAQIRRAGRWNGEKMEGCYLKTLPKKAMRALAGFGSKTGLYWLPRSSVLPPPELQALVFPEVEKWEAVVKAADAREIAGRAFLQLLSRLRCVLLQDAAILKPLFPSHTMWKHPVFESPEFTRFSQSVRDAESKAAEDPLRTSLVQLPKNVALVIDEGFKAVHAKLAAMDQNVQNLTDRISAPQAVHYILQPVPAPSSMISPECPSTGPWPADLATEADCVEESRRTFPPASPFEFKLSRALETVEHVWREYSVGKGSGPAVVELENSRGSSWRQSGTETRFFNRRKVFYNRVQEFAEQRAISGDAASRELENLRRTLGLSLNKFAAYLKVSRSDVAL